MAVIKLPEGVEYDLKVYLMGVIEGVETEIVVTLGGLPAFSDDVLEQVDLLRLVKSQNLDDLGTDWRIMTRDEITEFKVREREADEFAAP